MAESPQPYRVLARKYRPQTFAELIGQDAMVTTLGNAIRRDRLAHAFLLTGVRGVGKTSTARLIAKALNCIGPDGQGGPTIDPCGVCAPCVTIAEGRNVDVIEMDAASNTGVDDMRSVIDIVRNTGFGARFQIFIIDEVHMLSRNAFNALLKTLEEPPEHVKFLLATTEVNKVPVTVLSRCQRFDLRRIPAELLADHFARVAQAEGVAVQPEALALIARAAEGSARDGLSILDQAIAHAGMGDSGQVTAQAVRDMLGLSDRGAIRDLFALLLKGEAAAALRALRSQYDHGVDPLAVLRTLLETVHGVTLAKVAGDHDATHSVEEREAMAGWAAALSFSALHRLWQLLLKGHDEVARAALPIEACEMALLRIIHASSLPDPGELARQLTAGTLAAPAAAPASLAAPAPAAEPVAAAPKLPVDLRGLAELLEAAGRHQLALHLRDNVRLVRYAAPEVALAPARPLPSDFSRELVAALKLATDTSWTVTMGGASEAPTLHEEDEAREKAARDAILATPIVAAAFETFPDAELIGWTHATRSGTR